MADQNMYKFNDVSLLITHYNRSSSLKRLLQGFKDLNCFFGEIIVSDDGSDLESLSSLEESRKLFNFKLIKSSENRGLGHNINKGQDAVTLPYTLYVQEDFVPTAHFPDRFNMSLNIMTNSKDIDLVRFYAYLKFPYLREYGNGFSEMYLEPWQMDYTKIYAYSDHPHLRRSTFFEKFGRYSEGIKGDKTEYRMCISFIRNKGKGIFFDNYQTLFQQINSESEPSTMKRKSWSQTQNPIITFFRNLYRQVKYNYDIYLS